MYCKRQAAFARICATFISSRVACLTGPSRQAVLTIMSKPVETTICWLIGLWLFAGVFTEIFEEPIIRNTVVSGHHVPRMLRRTC